MGIDFTSNLFVLSINNSQKCIFTSISFLQIHLLNLVKALNYWEEIGRMNFVLLIVCRLWFYLITLSSVYFKLVLRTTIDGIVGVWEIIFSASDKITASQTQGVSLCYPLLFLESPLFFLIAKLLFCHIYNFNKYLLERHRGLHTF